MNFDVAMPTALLIVTITTMFLNKRVEAKLKATFEEKEFHTRDIIFLVAMIGVAATVAAIYPNIQTLLLAVFLFSYSILLFTFSYLFSNITKVRAQLFSAGLGIASLTAGTGSFFNPFADNLMLYGSLAFFGLAAFAFFTVIYEQKRGKVKERLHLAVLPPTLFLLLYLFYRDTPVWYPYLLDIYAVTFAILVTLYLGSLFTWKTTFIFAGFLTIMDIILVLGTKTMGEAATTFLNLGLPILVLLPNVPLRIVDGVVILGGLGLGDFFFAGILAGQTYKKFGKKSALVSVLAMAVSFEFFAVLQMAYRVQFFPATVNIICGWLPVVAWKLFAERKTNNNRVKVESKIGVNLAEQGT